MNFTREPIIETIITPKDGYKILVRNSKAGGQEEYFVDAVEVVSFGNSFFFRSLERPKSFLVPVGDYEIIEMKETRVALKNASIERSIKIGGGREAPIRGQKEPVEKSEETSHEFVAQETSNEETQQEAPTDHRMDRKRDRRRHRRRRMPDERQEQREWNDKQRSSAEGESSQPVHDKSVEHENVKEEQKQSAPSFSTLFPPPPTLISQTLSRYKDMGAGEGNAHQEQSVEEKKEQSEHRHHKHEKKEKDHDEDFPGSDATSLHRMNNASDPSFSSTSIPRSSASFFDGGFFKT